MAGTLHADLCVVGAGSGGLSVAAGAARLGLSVVLFERARMGGDCLNTGCVPSKALLAAAAAAASSARAAALGVDLGPTRVDFARVRAHVHDVIAQIAPHDSVERFEGLGVHVIAQHARFAGPREIVAADGTRVVSRRFVVATGSRAAVPPIPGLDAVPYETNETIFERTTMPAHLLVIGGGPIGMELAQAFRRLGSAVTVIEAQHCLGNDDPVLAAIVRDALLAEGVAIHEGTYVRRVALAGDGGVGLVVAGQDGEERTLVGSDVLVAVGRRPNIEDLGLEAAGIAAGPRGIVVDRRLRTSNRRVWAVGDVAGGLQFTHVAGWHAGLVLRNALFRLPVDAAPRAVPWVTYADPELAHVGLTEAQARARHGDRVRVTVAPFADNDRARAERRTAGLVKVVAGRGGRILGCSIAGAHAGELIQPWVLALSRGLKLSAMAGMIAPYPTLGEAGKSAAGAWYEASLFSPATRALVRLLRHLP
ncbi:MAG: dihydrolipoamide dehydrogenase [Alphaproteobacteria bacterium]|nr:dihydrolipoamide dehydrogenase [Alphaproteobacteria bacterium]